MVLGLAPGAGSGPSLRSGRARQGVHVITCKLKKFAKYSITLSCAYASVYEIDPMDLGGEPSTWPRPEGWKFHRRRHMENLRFSLCCPPTWLDPGHISLTHYMYMYATHHRPCPSLCPLRQRPWTSPPARQLLPARPATRAAQSLALPPAPHAPPLIF